MMSDTAASFAIMDGLMDAIECNDVWNQIQQTDPMIQQAEQARYAAEKEAAAILPRDLFNRLSEATTSIESAMVTAAILYGMRVSAAIPSPPPRLTRWISPGTYLTARKGAWHMDALALCSDSKQL